jgi:hypothetical protein
MLWNQLQLFVAAKHSSRYTSGSRGSVSLHEDRIHTCCGSSVTAIAREDPARVDSTPKFAASTCTRAHALIAPGARISLEYWSQSLC